MKLTPWLVLISMLFVSCSGSKSAQKVSEETPQIELSAADEVTEDPIETPLADGPTDQVVEEVPAENVEGMNTTEEPIVTDNTPVVEESISGSIKKYTVQKNETLMMIAFNLYGDYGRWKDLANQNQSILKGSTSLRNGMELEYMSPAEEFVWNPQGNPYLIRTGDTLGIISKEVYATSKKWKLIWENNKPLIKDPNKIYAGFTIFYLENGREVANEI